MGAPVCHDSRDQVIIQPPPKQHPAIPVATDLKSALAAISVLKQIVENLTQPHIDNGGGGQTINTTPPVKQPRWTQATRTTEKVKITNPDDPSQYVEIERIKSLSMKDGITGDSWQWNR
jgi:hypothetical protein